MSDLRVHEAPFDENNRRLETPVNVPTADLVRLSQPADTGEQNVLRDTGEFAAAIDAVVEPDLKPRPVMVNGEVIHYTLADTEAMGIQGFYDFIDGELWISDRVDPIARVPLIVFAVLFESGEYTPEGAYKKLFDLAVMHRDNNYRVMVTLSNHFKRINTDGASSVDRFLRFLESSMTEMEAHDGLQ